MIRTIPKNMDVAVLQLSSAKRYQENLDKLLEYVREHQDKKLIVAPEVYSDGL